jgi:hypothetical protein
VLEGATLKGPREAGRRKDGGLTSSLRAIKFASGGFMKPAPLTLLTLGLAAVAAWPLSQLRAAPAKDESPAVQRVDCDEEDAEEAPSPHALVLPPGHPPVDLRHLLPPGHPPVGGDADALPPGHPALPPGHPPIPSGNVPLVPFGEPAVYEI